MAGFLVTFDIAVSALELSFRPQIRLYSCRSSKLVSANSLALSSPALEGTVPLLVIYPPFNVYRKKNAINSTYDELSVSGMRETLHLVADVFCRSFQTVLFRSEQQFTVGENLLAAMGS